MLFDIFKEKLYTDKQKENVMFENVFKVFTKEHQENAEYLDVKFSMRSKIKLKNVGELIDEKIERLINCGYKSNCCIGERDII